MIADADANPSEAEDHMFLVADECEAIDQADDVEEDRFTIVGNVSQVETSGLAAAVQRHVPVVVDDTLSQLNTKEDLDDAEADPDHNEVEKHTFPVADEFEAFDQAASAAIKMQSATSISAPGPHSSVFLLTASLLLHSRISVQLKVY
jgi:hypothetical protein